MSVLFLSNDLMFSSRVSLAGRAIGEEVTTCGGAEALLERASASDGALVILDLSTPGLDVEYLVRELRRGADGLRCIAFAPHVHEAKLAAAVDAGCDEVLSRGQFNQRLDELLTKYLVD